MPAEPFDVFVRRVAPEHAHLILAEIERLRELLFEAFVEGFEQSCEGFNGEYVGEPYRGPGLVEASLRPEFDEWLAQRCGETSPDVAPACGDACGDGG